MALLCARNGTVNSSEPGLANKAAAATTTAAGQVQIV